MNESADLDDSDIFVTHKYFNRKSTNIKNENSSLNDICNNVRKKRMNAGSSDGEAKDHTIQSANDFGICSTLIKNGDSEDNVRFNLCDILPNSTVKKICDNKTEKSEIKHEGSSVSSCYSCAKNFNSEIEKMSHSKQCMKKIELTSKEMLEALKEHKNELKERMAHRVLHASQKTQSQIDFDTDSRYGLALGLALSNSLQQHGNVDGTATVDDAPAIRKTTLRHFGFTTSSCHSAIFGRKKKSRVRTRSTLRDRTKETRERLITDKASAILLSTADGGSELARANLLREAWAACAGYSRAKCHSPYLWTLGENEDGTKWYVDELRKAYFSCDTAAENGKLCRRDNTQEAIRKLKLPRPSIVQDWSKLINERRFSDLSVRTDYGETVFLHSSVIFARCPTLLETDLRAAFSKVGRTTLFAFLKYLYCGLLDGLTRAEVESLFCLARSVHYGELVDVMSALKEELGCGSGTEASIAAQSETTGRSGGDGRFETSIDLQSRFSCSSPFYSHREASVDGEKFSVEKPREDCPTRTRVEQVDDEDEHESRRFSDGESDVRVAVSGAAWKNPIRGYESEMQREKEEKQDISFFDPESDMFVEMESSRENGNCSTVIGDEIPNGKEEEIAPCEVAISSESSENGDAVPVVDKSLTEQSGPECHVTEFDPYEHFEGDWPMFDSVQSHGEETESPGRGYRSPHRSLGDAHPFASASGVEEADFRQPFTSTPRNSTSRRGFHNNLEAPERETDCAASTTTVGRYRRKCSPSALESVEFGRNADTTTEQTPFGTNGETCSIQMTPVVDESRIREKWSEPCTNAVEVSPASPLEISSNEPSPAPDYAAMGVSTMKKHLTKYGIKKSLNKNKARKVLSHIYEELHPVLNVNSGKIIKFIKMQQEKNPRREISRRKHCRGYRAGKKLNVNELDKIDDETPARSPPRVDDGKEIGRRHAGSNREQSSKGNDAAAAIADYISSDSDFRRKVLMYEPIWLDDFQNKLCERYNERYLTADILDALDYECITFRYKYRRRRKKRHAA